MVDQSDLQLYTADTMATNATATNIGGGPGTPLISGALPGEIFYTMPSDPGVDQDQFAKVFYANDNAASDLSDAKVWIENSLDAGPSGNYFTEIVPSSPADNASKRARIVGENSSDTPDFERVTLAGASSVFGGTMMARLITVELETSASPTDAPVRAFADDDILIRRNGVTVGKIPAGFSSATAELDLWLPSTLNDTSVADDPASEPTGASWSRPRTYEGGADVANSGVLTHEMKQGVWLRWRQRAGRLNSGSVDVVLGLSGVSA